MHRGLNLSTHDLIRWCLYALIFFVPMSGVIGEPIVTLTFLRVVTLLIVAVWGLQIFAQGGATYRRSPLNPWLAVYGILLIIITLGSPHSWSDFFGEPGTFRGLITVLNVLFITLVVLNFFQRKEEIHGALKIGGMGILLGLVLAPTQAFVHRTMLEFAVHGVLVLLWATLVWKTLHSRTVKLSVKILAVFLFGLGLAYEIGEGFNGSNLIWETLFFILTGLAVSHYHILVDSTPQSRQFKQIQLARLSKLAFTLVVLLAWLLSAWFTVRQVSADYALKQGDLSRRDNNVQAMLASYRKATQQIPWMPALWERYGDGANDAAIQSDLPDISEQLLETALHAYGMAEFRSGGRPELWQKMGEAYLKYARILEKRGRYAKAEEAHVEGIKLYRQAGERGGEDPRFAYAYAALLMEEKRYDEAEEVFNAILEKSESYQDIHYQLALIATELKQYDEARSYIQQALQQNAADDRVKALLQRINQETRENP